MHIFKNQITLAKNKRGCYILDTVKGCSGCNPDRPRGCYGDCYAYSIATRYGRDFSKIVKRDFPKDDKQYRLFDFVDACHTEEVFRQVEKIDMPFLRVGELGDPSEDWEHTLNVCKIISAKKKPIVIVTKHWKAIPEELLPRTRGLLFNTSISALDSEKEIEHRLNQYYRLGKYCNSVLRIVSCDFNTQNSEGGRRLRIQEKLFKHAKIVDTVFQPNKNNPLVLSGVVKTRVVHFMRSEKLASVYSENPFLGMCSECPDMCGLKYA